eukprot:TRINITY_DN3190_c1_g1_i4.p1 TRINITY_DN3190_c1_g1~~TRINITY_DN3190_c1_g1_i4.p1  ORF type:complete len:802 (+),score=200.05 TRINITY_DN3190_c1_g1_i4:109-2514(+)
MGCNSSSQHAKEPTSAGTGAPVLLGNAEHVTEKPENTLDKESAMEQNKRYHARISFISQVPLFMWLERDNYPILAAAFTNEEYEAGCCIVTQGEEGRDFFVIEFGEAEVIIAEDGVEQKVALLKPGDYFGENALMRNAPRSATIKAAKDVKALKISQDKFMELGFDEKIQFAQRNRQRVGAGRSAELVVKPPSPKTAEEHALMEKTLWNNQNIQMMVKLDAQRVKELINVAWREEVAAGTEVITEGDVTADYFYICQSGRFDVLMSQKGKPSLVQSITAGGSFGELALLYSAPRAATVKAQEKSTVWVIDRKSFKDIVMKVSEEKIQKYVNYLDKVEVLSPLLAAEKLQVAKALLEMHYQEKEVIINQGDVGLCFYILFEGEVSVAIDGNEKATLQANEERGQVQIFGERALLNNEPRAATITVRSKSAKVLVLDKDSFDQLLGPLENLGKRDGSQDVPTKEAVAAPVRRTWATLSYRQPILKNDLERVGLLGVGGFGKVELWEHKHSGNTYAMKGISKGWIVKTGMQHSIISEKNILSMTKSAFIIRLYETYTCKEFLYFLMEPALGGEIFSIYHKKNFYGSEKHARFYSAGVIMAFEHLHTRHIIYRDLKPENLLLCEKGHLKLTDMGLAKFVIGKTHTTCGTPEYFAPEVIMSSGQTQAVDWWTLGVLLFELMTASVPFEAATPFQIYAKVKQGIDTVKFPPKLPKHFEGLVKALCQKEPADRLPMRANGVQNLKTHAWFKGLDWGKFAALELGAPFVPEVKSKKDLNNFHVDPADMPQFVSYVDDGSGWDKDFATSQ